MFLVFSFDLLFYDFRFLLFYVWFLVNCIERHESLTKKIDYDVIENEDYDREDIATYEEVIKYYPRPASNRPIVLIGPPGVGRNELKRRLIDTNPTKYKTTIPCEG